MRRSQQWRGLSSIPTMEVFDRSQSLSFSPPAASLPSALVPQRASHSAVLAVLCAVVGIKQAQRAAVSRLPDSLQYEYLRDEVARRLIDRLSDITRTFPNAADVGCNALNIARLLSPGQSGIRTLLSLDTSLPSLLPPPSPPPSLLPPPLPPHRRLL